MKHVLITEPIHNDARQMFASRGDIETTYLEGDTTNLQEAVMSAHGILVRTLKLDKTTLAGAPKLEVVSRHGVGCDSIDVVHLSQRNIPMAIATDSNTTSVVEHVLMMMLVLNKRAIEFDGFTRNDLWSEKGKHKTSELFGKNVLIIGFGRIGKRVAPVCKALGMNVTVADIALDESYATQLSCKGVEDFRPYLAQSDYVTIHVPLDESTRNLIGKNELALLPEHAILINCARGGVVKEEALAQAISEGQLAGTGCDVFTTEPVEQTNPLLSLPNSVFTPHNAAGTDEGMQRMSTYAAQNILDHFDGKLGADFIFNFDALNS